MPFSLLIPTSFVIATVATAPEPVEAIELSWERYAELIADQPVDPGATPPGPWVSDRRVDLRPVAGGWELRARWTVQVQRAGWMWRTLTGPDIELRRATFDGAPLAVVPMPRGSQLALWVERGGEIEVHAFLPGSPDDDVSLTMMPATRGRLTVASDGRIPVPTIDASTGDAPPVLDGGIVWSGASTVGFELRDPDQAPAAHQALAVAHAGVGLTVGDAELRGRAHLQWELRHGALPRVRATVSGLGADLTVSGRDVATWSRQGDTLEVELGAPATGRIDLDLRWTQAIPAGDEASITLPRIEPEAWRSEASLQVARDGEHEVIPRAEQWTAVAAASLPEWGQGLVEGTPTAAYQRSGGHRDGALDLLRFVPVPGPPTVVDVATYTAATTEEGRVLMRAHYELRNDRGAHLTVRPPPGLRIIGARVAGQTALPSRDEQGAWRIPLKRSLETVEGLLSFPVEVTLMGEQESWARREQRELALPTLDAPIAASRATIHLPPGYQNRLQDGDHTMVDEFNRGEGLTYGMAAGQGQAAVADSTFQQAVDGYLANDFEGAQAKLDELERLGMRNQNTERLQANIDVIEGKDKGKNKADLTLQRRVKEQARARAAEEFREQETLIVQAEQAAQSGDYDEAEANYEAALELGDKLAKFEQTESVEQIAVNSQVALDFKTIAEKASRRRDARVSKRRSKRATKSSSSSSSIGRGSGGAGEGQLGADAALVIDHANDEPLDPPAPVTGIDAAGQGTTREATPPAVVLEPEPPSEPEPEPEPEPPVDAEDQRVFSEREQLDDEDNAPLLARRPPQPLDAVQYERGPRRGRRGMKYKRTMRRGSRRGGGKRAKSNGVSVYDFDDDSIEDSIDGQLQTPRQVPAAATATTIADAPNQDLPAPKVNASAMSVVIPATGRAVLYQQLLLDANETQIITIDARRRLRRR